MGDLLLVFVKWPKPGSVKTRLAERIGHEEAANIYRLLVRRVMERILPLSSDLVAICWVFDPPDRETEITEWIQNEIKRAGFDTLEVCLFWPQSDGDLGDRLGAAFRRAFSFGFKKVVAIGTDCVDLDSQIINKSLASLSGNQQLVFGPTRDGGYYLVGMKSPSSCLVFEDISWSTSATLQQSVNAAVSAGLDFTLLEEFIDVDTVEDWELVRNLI